METTPHRTATKQDANTISRVQSLYMGHIRSLSPCFDGPCRREGRMCVLRFLCYCTLCMVLPPGRLCWSPLTAPSQQLAHRGPRVHPSHVGSRAAPSLTQGAGLRPGWSRCLLSPPRRTEATVLAPKCPESVGTESLPLDIGSFLSLLASSFEVKGQKEIYHGPQLGYLPGAPSL